MPTLNCKVNHPSESSFPFSHWFDFSSDIITLLSILTFSVVFLPVYRIGPISPSFGKIVGEKDGDLKDQSPSLFSSVTLPSEFGNLHSWAVREQL